MRVFVIGCPHDVGGAGPHCWHTVRLWRDSGIDVHFIPINPVELKWQERLLSIGCEIDYHLIGNGINQLRNIDGLPGGIVIAFCNGGFLEIAPQLRVLGCKTIWLGCMNWLHPEEVKHYERWGPFDRYVFQSQFQQQSLTKNLERYGYNSHRMARIPSPINVDEYPFKPLPHESGEPFCIGRISRSDPLKYTNNLWEIYGNIKTNIRARIMAWDNELEKIIGRPPLWAECLPKGAETVSDFMSSLHCMVQVGQTKENRPRSCLEAMACGVPVVAPNEGGWKELIRHGYNGFLCNDPSEIDYYVTTLANDENQRLKMIETARVELNVIANPDDILNGWKELFGSL
jgi:glycosyltransferase involved in cell wall biosynthesis